MNSIKYFNTITERLDYLSLRIQRLGNMNLQDINIHVEYFFMHFLNELFGWNLINTNNIAQNFPGVDLMYDGGNIVIQVTSTVTKEKVQHSLDKLDAIAFKGYTFKFLSIAKEADHLRGKAYNVPQGINFDSSKDILDIKKLYPEVLALDIDRQKFLCKLTTKYISFNTDNEKRIKGLARIIEILSSDKFLNEDGANYKKHDFEIEDKIRKNGLDDIQSKIIEFSIHQTDVNNVYSIYDAEGVNKSRAVLHSINNVYLQLKKDLQGQDLFNAITDNICQGLQGEASLNEFYEEDVRYYVEIILIDSFMRCKIFENPNKN